MDQNPRCENCGRKRPCQPCEARAAKEREDLLLDQIASAQDGHPLMVWFDMPEDAALEHMTRTIAEWPGCCDVLDTGDLLGLKLALHPDDLSQDPSAEYVVTATHVRKLNDTAFLRELKAKLGGK